MLETYFSQKITVKVFLLSLTALSAPAMAFDCQSTDKQLSQALVMSNKYGSYGDVYDERDDEKTNTANAKIKTIIAQTAKNATSMACQFNQAKKQGLHLETSDDKKFRAFSWDSNTGGTMHEFVSFIQYINDKGVSYAQPLKDMDFITSVFSTTVKGKALYLLTTTGIYSTAYHGQSLTLYQIDGDKLISPKLIKTKTGLTNQLGFEFDFTSVVNRIERPIKLFEFAKKSQTIAFPVVIVTDEVKFGKVINQKIRYQFDGNYFVKK